MHAILPPEILHDILGRITPSWKWGWRWKDKRERMFARADLNWFLNLRLVNKQFDNVVIDHFLAAIRAGLVTHDLPMCRGPPTGSTMAMGERLLWSLLCRSRGLHEGGTKTFYRLINTINAGVDGVVEFFSRSSHTDPEELRTSYLRGMISMFVGLTGISLVDRVLAPAWAGRGNIDLDGLDSETEGWSGAALVSAAYLGRIDDMEALLAWRLQNTADPDKSLYLPLMAAAFGGQMDIVRSLIERGVSRNTRTVGNGDTAMHFAALGGHAAIVEYFLEAGVEADVVNNAGDTPLLWAAGGGHADVVRVLLMAGEVNVNFRDRLKRAPLIWAAARGYDNVVKELLQREEIDVNLVDGNADVEVTPLAVAAVMGKEDVFQRLFHHPKVDRKVHTVFRRALIGGKVSIVRTIIEAIPDTLEDYEPRHYETALLRAAEEGSEEVVRYLLSLNAIPINYQDPNGMTAVHRAIQSGDLGRVRALLEHPDIDVNLTTIEYYDCQSPLHCAADQHRLDLEIVKALLARPDIIVNARDVLARTPLAFAAYKGQAEMVKLLLLRDDVDLFPADEDGNTPLLLAAEAGEKMIVNMLLGVADTDVWHRNHMNRTALALAAESGHIEVVRRLLDPSLEVTRDIIRDALENTKEALVVIRKKSTPFLITERKRLAKVRRMEEAHKLLLAFLDKMDS
ncbi:ankyrin repeat domain-containing protein [Aspergillus thermomutatus]|uniref:Uncharacterized protein n=1 Tax=Aspergillus thermomutatus TaxID=41047 RepID=A0A397G9U4_ASPTH|nr:uncharacterized protein CDV56_102724 [Aspergillus thermomutatus]RHZ47795.1 hypothetical protein CDV56_102724 [Aspergillus thermomutatus]